jgi:hypothetical protein
MEVDAHQGLVLKLEGLCARKIWEDRHELVVHDVYLV